MMFRLSSRVCWPCAVVLCCSAATVCLRAQNAPAPAVAPTPTQPEAAAQTVSPQTSAQDQSTAAPTFSITHREVVLDIVVTDKNAQPYRTLKREQMTVLEDLKEQHILSFTTPAEHVAPADAAPVASAADLRTRGNIPINIILLDELDTRFEDTAYGRTMLTKYFKTQPAILKQPTTIVSVSDSNLRVVHDYTQNRDDLLEAVKKHFPVYPFEAMKGGDGGTQLARCFGALLQIAQAVKGYPGRKNIIWIGHGFPSLNTQKVNQDKANELDGYVKLVTSSLLEARVVLNIVDPTQSSFNRTDFDNFGQQMPDQTLAAKGVTGSELFPDVISFVSFAPETGGFAYFARNDIDKQIESAIDDGSEYYTVAYSPTNQSDDPAPLRAITIKLQDPTLKAWTRYGYYTQKQTKPGELPPAPPVQQLAFDLTSAALAAMPYSGLDVSAEKETDGTSYKVTVAPIGVDYRRSKSGHTVAEMTVMEVAFGGNKQKVLQHDATEVTQTVPSTNEPFSFHVAVPETPGTNRVRIVVRDAISGHLGTVDVSFETHEPEKPNLMQRRGRKGGGSQQ